jgi:hypothetical protein
MCALVPTQVDKLLVQLFIQSKMLPVDACCCCRCGSRLLAEAHCSALVTAIRKTAGRSKRVHLFGRCLGLLEPVVPSAGTLSKLHCRLRVQCRLDAASAELCVRAAPQVGDRAAYSR